MAPPRGPRPELPPLGDNLTDLEAQAHTATHATSDTTDTTPVESIPGSSIATSSSCLSFFLALVPLARVYKLEAQMVTLMHYIQPWIQRSIAKVEERLERKMVQHVEDR